MEKNPKVVEEPVSKIIVELHNSVSKRLGRPFVTHEAIHDDLKEDLKGIDLDKEFDPKRRWRYRGRAEN